MGANLFVEKAIGSPDPFPVALWKMQESDFPIVDFSFFFSNNISSGGGTPTFVAYEGPMPETDTSIHLDSGDSLSRTHVVAGDQFTISLWIYLISTSGENQNIVRNGDNSTNGFSLTLNSNLKLQGVVPGVGNVTESVASIPRNTWTNIVVTRGFSPSFGNQCWQYFINGSLDSVVTDVDPANATGSTVIGDSNISAYYSYVTIFQNSINTQPHQETKRWQMYLAAITDEQNDPSKGYKPRVGWPKMVRG